MFSMVELGRPDFLVLLLDSLIVWYRVHGYRQPSWLGIRCFSRVLPCTKCDVEGPPATK